jgi:hypothetical protein
MNMFDDAPEQLDRILALVSKCPEPLQQKCFEILLTAYAQSATQLARPASNPVPPARPPARDSDVPAVGLSAIPDTVKGRFNTTVARLKAKAERLAALFDFQQDPFTYHGLAVPGENKATKTRNVALLLAFKSYLASGSWTADWKEFRAMCVDQSCYDRANTANFLSKGALFKTASSADGITLNSAGVTAAEALVASLAGGVTANDAVE